ncbi:MAG: 30S ribosomal protein S15 [Victivallales bacterium]|nr:30S ribosomal protein S15 [Victivallales bacterium]
MEKKAKEKIVGDFARQANDTGSPEVQIALLTHRIKEITKHLGSNKKDNSSRRGLIAMVNRRRRLLAYLRKEDFAAHNDVVERLKLRVAR